MSIFNDKDIPFRHIRYKRYFDTPMSSNLRKKYLEYYSELRSAHKGTREENASVLTEFKDKYRVLREEFITELRGQGVLGTIKHTEDELEFIFWGMLTLIQNLKIAQKEAAEVFGIKSNKLSSFDLYPQRAYKAFYKEDYISLVPNETNSLGIKIARVINKEVQAVHGCFSLVAITNDTDVFVNVAVDTDKAFFMSTDLNFDNTDITAIRKAGYDYARYLFTRINNLNQIFEGIKAGDIKKKIVSLLEMNDSLPTGFNNELVKIIVENPDKYLGYAIPDQRKNLKNNILKYDYCKCVIDDVNGFIEQGILPLFIDYSNELYPAFLGKGIKDNEKYILDCREKALNELPKLAALIMECIQQKKLMENNEDVLKAWIKSLRYDIENNLVHQVSDSNSKNVNDVVVRAIAGYWISEVFTNLEVNTENVNKVLEWLKTKNLLHYVDAINQEKSFGKQEHIRTVESDVAITSILNDCGFVNVKDTSRPFLLYIDAAVYKPEAEVIKTLSERNDCVCVVYDETGKIEMHGFRQLNKELHLYIKCFKEVTNEKANYRKVEKR